MATGWIYPEAGVAVESSVAIVVGLATGFAYDRFLLMLEPRMLQAQERPPCITGKCKSRQ